MSSGPRPYSGPMDFEYNNRIGPVNEHSAWMQGIRNNQQQQAQSSAAQNNNSAQKRPFSAFNSPQKSTSSFGELRSPSGSSLFSQPPQNGPDAAFMTPRMSREAEIPSSGPETSPDFNADNETTPDYNAMNKQKPAGANGTMRLFTANRQGLDGQHSPLAKRASGRGEIGARSANQIVKRRRKDSDKERQMLRHKLSAAFEDSSSDELSTNLKQSKSGKSQKQHHQPKQSTITSLFHFIDTHPSLPHILSWYAQLALNVALIAFFLYLVYTFWSTIRNDIDKKASEARGDVLAVIAACAKQFQDNGCDSSDRRLVPALEQPCAEWKRCMARDPNSTGMAHVSARTFAEIFNEFVEPISWKTMSFFVIIAVTVFGLGNGAFTLFRSRHLQQQGYVAQQAPQWMPPTPQHGQVWGTQAPDWSGWSQSTYAKQQRGFSPVRSAMEPGSSIEPQTPSRSLGYH